MCKEPTIKRTKMKPWRPSKSARARVERALRNAYEQGVRGAPKIEASKYKAEIAHLKKIIKYMATEVKKLDWDEKVLRLSIDILKDLGCHHEAKRLQKVLEHEKDRGEAKVDASSENRSSVPTKP